MKTKLIILLLSIFSYAQAYTYDPCPYADDIVVATIIMEAGGEYKHGALEAVYEVIMNRAKKRKMTPAEVCLQRKQFSCWNDKADGIKALEETIAQAKKHPRWVIAKNILGKQSNYTKGADHYHADYVDPYWAKSLTKTIKIGRHIFYK
jgi:spore germination cell wall hydrolase CwlJ-like protein|tara:strand:- start:343 stop:789 length:447 start_codon:yes stop_codon:yes gene_type:complete